MFRQGTKPESRPRTWGETRPAVYKKRMQREAVIPIVILGASVGMAAFLALVGTAALLGAGWLGVIPGRAIDVFALAILAGVAPYGFYQAHLLGRARKIEERLPDFLRELASSHKAGLTLPKAVRVAAAGEYGALTPEIKKMAAQLDWNVPFQEVLKLFQERVKTRFVSRAVALINEATLLGSNVSDVLMVAARDAREAKILEDQRRLTMGLYAGVVYISFFVFLVVVVVLYGTLITQLVATRSVASNLPVAGFTGGTLSLETYRTFYFTSALVQGLGNGVLAGLIQGGSAVAGLKHSFFMVLTAFFIFAFLLK